MSTTDNAQCTRCMHYFITFDPHFPYGCRAMNFKSRTLPGKEVEAAAGLSCQLFRPRPAAGRKPADEKQKGR